MASEKKRSSAVHFFVHELLPSPKEGAKEPQGFVAKARSKLDFVRQLVLGSPSELQCTAIPEQGETDGYALSRTRFQIWRKKQLFWGVPFAGVAFGLVLAATIQRLNETFSSQAHEIAEYSGSTVVQALQAMEILRAVFVGLAFVCQVLGFISALTMRWRLSQYLLMAAFFTNILIPILYYLIPYPLLVDFNQSLEAAELGEELPWFQNLYMVIDGMYTHVTFVALAFRDMLPVCLTLSGAISRGTLVLKSLFPRDPTLGFMTSGFLMVNFITLFAFLLIGQQAIGTWQFYGALMSLVLSFGVSIYMGFKLNRRFETAEDVRAAAAIPSKVSLLLKITAGGLFLWFLIDLKNRGAAGENDPNGPSSFFEVVGALIKFDTRQIVTLVFRMLQNMFITVVASGDFIWNNYVETNFLGVGNDRCEKEGPPSSTSGAQDEEDADLKPFQVKV